MAWTEVCKINFFATADALRQNKKMNVTKVIDQMSKETDISKRTLWRWWSEMEKAREIRAAEIRAEAEDAQKERDEQTTANNGSKKSNLPESTPEPVADTKTLRGGRREGAGRPKKKIDQEAMWIEANDQLIKVLQYIERNFEPPTKTSNGTKTEFLGNLKLLKMYFE